MFRFKAGVLPVPGVCAAYVLLGAVVQPAAKAHPAAPWVSKLALSRQLISTLRELLH